MSLTSYRAAPPRVYVFIPWGILGWIGGPGGDLLSRALRHSTMGAGAFHGRVRDGIGCRRPAKATRSSNPSFSDRWVADPRSVKGECGSGCCVCGHPEHRPVVADAVSG